MVGERIIRAPHDSNGFWDEGMDHDPTSRTTIYQGTVNEYYGSHSAAVGAPSAFRTPSSCNSHMPTTDHTSNVQQMPTGALEQQTSPLQTKVTSNEQHWMSPDRQFRPILPRPETFRSSPRFTSSIQSVDDHISPNPEPGTSSRLNGHLGSKERLVDHGIRFESLIGHEILAHGQISSPPQDDRLACSKVWERGSVQAPVSRWKQARDYRRKVYEPPYLDPHTDDSIAHVEANAEFWVDQLITSITNTKDVKDTATSHHRRLFSSKAIDFILIEACSREIFTALIDRCKNGFHGPPTFNKALKSSYQLESDRTATCEERIHNVTKVLSWNKRACKDVLYEDWKIKLLVNHPLSYDKEKDSQKESNDQRRKRQLATREKMERTEEELKAYREAHQEAIGSNTSTAQYEDNSFSWEKNTKPEWLLHNDEGGLKLEEFRNPTGKRPAYRETERGNVKRQRV
jgi:hypothetical protein